MRKQNRTKYTVLGMLSLENMTGYEITKIIKVSINNFWAESEGQIYPALAQCVDEELATCKEVKTKENKRSKKIYSITAKGKKELKEWLKKEAQETQVRNELLLKLFYGANIDSKDNIQHLTHHQKQVENELASYEVLQENLKKDHKDSPHLKYWLITINCALKILKAELAWCKESLKTLAVN